MLVFFTGNLTSFIARIYLDKSTKSGSFSIFVSCLAVSDMCMGVYLAIVGGADIWYSGRYLFHDEDWKQSSLCRLAGILSFTSCEVSAITICVITLDRCVQLGSKLSS